jgi:hypothetical protein
VSLQSHKTARGKRKEERRNKVMRKRNKNEGTEE